MENFQKKEATRKYMRQTSHHSEMERFRHSFIALVTRISWVDASCLRSILMPGPVKPWTCITIATTLTMVGGTMVWITSRGQRESSHAPLKPVPATFPTAGPRVAGIQRNPTGTQPQKVPALLRQLRGEPGPQFPGNTGTFYEGKAIAFELLNRQIAAGTILRQQSSVGQLTYISGQLTEPASGRFFFHTQTLPGVAGPFSGVVELPSLGIAYRVEPAASTGDPNWCSDRCATSCVWICRGPTSGAWRVGEVPPLNPADSPGTDSRVPEWSHCAGKFARGQGSHYLDFQGGYTESWGGIAYQRSNFGNADILEIWRRVSEDYSMPFNISKQPI